MDILKWIVVLGIGIGICICAGAFYYFNEISRLLRGRKIWKYYMFGLIFIILSNFIWLSSWLMNDKHLWWLFVITAFTAHIIILSGFMELYKIMKKSIK